MIVNLYNHPSIFFWGMWNELRGSAKIDKFQGPLDTQKVVAWTAELYRLAKSLDPSRPVGLTDCTIFKRDGYKGLQADFYSQNQYFGWYKTYGDFSGITPTMEWIRDNMGPSNISEYGVGVNPFCHTWDPSKAKRDLEDDSCHYEEYGNMLHEAYVRQILKMPWLGFTSAWVMFDFPVANRNEGYMDCADGTRLVTNESRKYMNDKGLVTRDRQTKKDVFYLYKSLWNKKETTVYITSRRLRSLPAGRDFTIQVYSNAKSLTLYQNGKQIARQVSSGEDTGVIWTFPGIRLKKDSDTFRVVANNGVKDEVTWTSL
jgi:beta-galactosidase